MIKIGCVSLGCDKNRVDSEKMLQYLVEKGFEIVSDPSSSDLIIVNTCAFIESAREEAVDTILEMNQYKKTNPNLKILVTGCLPELYGTEVFNELTEVDGYLGVNDYPNIDKVINSLVGSNERINAIRTCNIPLEKTERLLTTPNHYAYLKIADGCNNACSYCIIPKIRGKYVSTPIEKLVEEANFLASVGVKELILVAQDVSYYGMDLYKEFKIVELIRELSKIEGIEWIRLLYLYPDRVGNELINEIKNNNKVCKYVDIPMQHVSDKILFDMMRLTSKERIIKLVSFLKQEIPHIAIRSSFIVGFPGETKSNFDELLDFVKTYKLSNAGFFKYCREEGTRSYSITNQVSEKVKEERIKKAREAQSLSLKEFNNSLIGKTIKVLYEDIDYDKNLFVGRCEYQAPEIDGVVYFKSKDLVEVGEFYNVKITSADDLDLYGEVV